MLEERELFLDLGGDDYVTKPFTADELRFRVRANLRRAKEAGAISRRLPYDDGYLRIDFAAHKVSVSGSEVLITGKEYDLLENLVLNEGTVLAYRDLLEKVWGKDYISDTNLVYVAIAHLRAAIESDPAHRRYIINVPRFGYRFQRPRSSVADQAM